MIYKDDCLGCVFYNMDGTCGNRRSEMYGIATNGRELQLCGGRRNYSREAAKKYRRKRKIETIWDYE